MQVVSPAVGSSTNEYQQHMPPQYVFFFTRDQIKVFTCDSFGTRSDYWLGQQNNILGTIMGWHYFILGTALTQL